MQCADASTGSARQRDVDAFDGFGILRFLDSMPSVTAVRTSLSLAPTSFF